MKRPRILAIDLGLLAGYCFVDEDGSMTSGLWRLPDKPDHARYVALHELVANALDVRMPTLLAYEWVRHYGGHIDIAHTYGGLRAVMLLAAANSKAGKSKRLKLDPINPAQVKAAAGLPSSASKPEIVAAAQARWPDVTFSSDDECDARFVAVAAMGGTS